MNNEEIDKLLESNKYSKIIEIIEDDIIEKEAKIFSLKIKEDKTEKWLDEKLEELEKYKTEKINYLQSISYEYQEKQQQEKIKELKLSELKNNQESENKEILKIKSGYFLSKFYNIVPKEELFKKFNLFKDKYGKLPMVKDVNKILKKYNIVITEEELYYYVYGDVIFGFVVNNEEIGIRDDVNDYKHNITELDFLTSFDKEIKTLKFNEIIKYPKDMLNKYIQYKSSYHIINNQKSDLFSSNNKKLINYLLETDNLELKELKNKMLSKWSESIKKYKVIFEINKENEYLYELLLKGKDITNILNDLTSKNGKINVNMKAIDIEEIVYKVVKALNEKNKEFDEYNIKDYYYKIKDTFKFKKYLDISERDLEILVEDVKNINKISSKNFKNYKIIHLEKITKNQKGYDYLITDSENKIKVLDDKNEEDILLSYKWKKGREYSNLSLKDLDLGKIKLKTYQKDFILKVDSFIKHKTKIMDLFEERTKQILNNTIYENNTKSKLMLKENGVDSLKSIGQILESIDSIIKKEIKNNDTTNIKLILSKIKEKNFLLDSLEDNSKIGISSLNYIVKHFYLDKNGRAKKDIKTAMKLERNWDDNIFEFIKEFYENNIEEFVENTNNNEEKRIKFLKNIYHIDVSDNSNSYLIENGGIQEILKSDFISSNIKNLSIKIDNIKNKSGSLIFDIIILHKNKQITKFISSTIRYKKRKFVGSLSFNVSSNIKWNIENELKMSLLNKNNNDKKLK